MFQSLECSKHITIYYSCLGFNKVILKKKQQQYFNFENWLKIPDVNRRWRNFFSVCLLSFCFTFIYALLNFMWIVNQFRYFFLQFELVKAKTNASHPFLIQRIQFGILSLSRGLQFGIHSLSRGFQGYIMDKSIGQFCILNF